ncbi:alpha/beta hydrolase [Frondihabitans cladoniiphilus]|uniref:Alpha/beta hydrolase-fold protein n=1 Tax=Frondihabitans cladoniiphilus TaxID=715785 RepID=A0ABP8VNN9_9MICO
MISRHVLEFSLVSVKTLVPVYLLAAVFAVALVVPARKSRGMRIRLLAFAAVGAALGVFLGWFLGDVLDIVGIPPTWVDRVWVAVVTAGIGLVVAACIDAPVRRRVLAGTGVVVIVLAGALAVNRDAGLFPEVGDALGVPFVQPIVLPSLTAAERADTTPPPRWNPPSDLPRAGRYGSIAIPGHRSGFPARAGIVYLPPAALVSDAPALPVVVLLSGQGPGAAPANLVDAGRVASSLDALAARNDGLAPIVVIPDQLSLPANNPMCVDGPLGNSATYLTVDVPTWIRSHLHVATDPRDWAIGGFSQGGTCAIQLGSAHPTLYGSFIDVSGEKGPSLDSLQDTIDRGFSGSRAAYDQAQPLAILAAHGRYADSAAFFAVGASDSRYGPVLPVLSSAAREEGIDVTTVVIPHSGHDYATASKALALGLAWFEQRTRAIGAGR